MSRTIASVAVALLAVALSGCVPTASAPAPATTPTSRELVAALYARIASDPATPNCEHEDGSELSRVGQVCRWDAGTSGNGVGQSFVVLAVANAAADGAADRPALVYVYADGSIEV